MHFPFIGHYMLLNLAQLRLKILQFAWSVMVLYQIVSTVPCSVLSVHYGAVEYICNAGGSPVCPLFHMSLPNTFPFTLTLSICQRGVPHGVNHVSGWWNSSSPFSPFTAEPYTQIEFWWWVKDSRRLHEKGKVTSIGYSSSQHVGCPSFVE